MFEEAETIYAAAPADLAAWLAGLDLQQTIAGQNASGTAAQVIHPASGLPIGTCHDATTAHAEAAVAAAASAFPGWAATAWDSRRAALEAFADLLWDQRQTLSFLVAAETGRPLRRAWSEVFFAVDYVRTIAAQVLPERDYTRPGTTARLVHRPLGVAVAIAPWNGPVILAVAKIANALLAGDTLVLRPAPQTPLSALYMGMLGRACFPPGVFNVITGDAHVAQWLCTRAAVAKISFTGSTATGRLIAAAAAPQLKRLTLELGGNDAAIALADADAAAVAATAYRISLENAGQFCAAIKRLYVHADIYDAVRSGILDAMATARAGDCLDPASTLAPLQSAAQHARVSALAEAAKAGGAVLHTADMALPQGGFFLAPTLAENCTADMALVAEEQFGPVLPIIRFTDVEDAITAANTGEYGLGGSIWTADTARGIALAERLDTGTAWVNQHGAFSAALPMPFARQSGLGMDYAEFGVAHHSRAMLIAARS